jgi:hypothetical protein
MNVRRFKMQRLRAAAAHRQAGYVEEVLRLGQTKGEWVILSGRDYHHLHEKYGGFPGVRRRSEEEQAESQGLHTGVGEGSTGLHL